MKIDNKFAWKLDYCQFSSKRPFTRGQQDASNGTKLLLMFLKDNVLFMETYNVDMLGASQSFWATYDIMLLRLIKHFMNWTS